MISSKSFCLFFLVAALLEVKIHTVSIIPTEVSSSNQEQTKQFINQLDATLSEIVNRFPDNITAEEFDDFTISSFKIFYKYITATKPKAQIHALIMYLQYAELIFKHGITSKQLQLKDAQTKNDFFYQFLTTWENMFNSVLDPITDSLYDVITSPNQNTTITLL